MDGNECPNIVMETERAVETILIKDHDYTQKTHTDLKRKQPDSDNQPINTSITYGTNTYENENKKTHFKRYYKQENNGPYEVIIQDKNKQKLNPFTIGKIIKHNHSNISHIIQTGKNITVTCNTYSAANSLVDSANLKQYNVFVPTNKIYTVGVVNIDPDIPNEEILQDIESEFEIIQIQRLKRSLNKTLVDTSFVKIIFDSDKLPEYVYLNYVRLKVNIYMMPVKQCFRCFAYGHVASSPCNRPRLCRDCGKDFHSGECQTTLKCINCNLPHSSNSKRCPEYQRQRKIKERMSIFKEDYHKASILFPPIKNKYTGNYVKRTYAEATTSNNLESDLDRYKTLTDYTGRQRLNSSNSDLSSNITNRYTILQSNETDTSKHMAPYNTRPITNNYRTKPSSFKQTTKTNQSPVTPNTSTHKQQIKNIPKEEIEKLKDLIKVKLEEFKKKCASTSTIKNQFDELSMSILSTLNDNTLTKSNINSHINNTDRIVKKNNKPIKK